MATVVTRIGPDGRRRYDVRYRDPAGVQRKRSFLRRTDAAAYSAIVEADKLRGAYVDRNAGRELFRVYADRWFAHIRHGSHRNHVTRHSMGVPGVRRVEICVDWGILRPS